MVSVGPLMSFVLYWKFIHFQQLITKASLPYAYVALEMTNVFGFILLMC